MQEASSETKAGEHNKVINKTSDVTYQKKEK
jgi:hypothetical protein